MKKLVFLIGISVISLLAVKSTQSGTYEVISSATVNTGKTFQVGDDVRLRTGGPIMTIEEVLTNNKLRCNFMNRRQEFEKGDYAVEDLERVDVELPAELEIKNTIN